MAKKKSKMPKFISPTSTTSAGAASSLLVHNRHNGTVAVAPHAAAAPPLPSKSMSFAPTEPAAARLGRSARKRANESTAGADWGHMKAPTMTTELKRDLLIVKMRNVLDKKRFYRSSDSGKGLPKYFQMGTIVEGAEDGQNKLTKKQRKRSMMEELMADATVRKRAKAQFLKSQEVAMAGRTKAKNKRGGAIGKKSGASARRQTARR